MKREAAFAGNQFCRYVLVRTGIDPGRFMLVAVTVANAAGSA